jgi:hypothetical protein
MHKVTPTLWGSLYSEPPKHDHSIGDFVRVASYITGVARTTLASTANLIGLKNIYYCDTDSLYVRPGTFPIALIS